MVLNVHRNHEAYYNIRDGFLVVATEVTRMTKRVKFSSCGAAKTEGRQRESEEKPVYKCVSP